MRFAIAVPFYGPCRLLRRGGGVLRGMLLLSTVMLCSHPLPAPAAKFNDVLATADIDRDQLAMFENFDGTWSASQSQIVAEILHLLDRFDGVQLDAWTVSPQQQTESGTPEGSLIQIKGVATAWAKSGGLVQLDVVARGGQKWSVLSERIPKAWEEPARDKGIAHPVAIRAVVLRSIDGKRNGLPLVLARWVEWRPDADVSSGWRLLARGGMDLALLDEVRHRQPFVKPSVSREGDAFYAMLAAASGYRADSLSRRAADEVSARVDGWRSISDDPPEPLEFPQQAAVARAALNRAELGLSSVAPLFLSPGDEVGRLVVLEGTARRCVPVVVEQFADDASAASAGVERYFELEVFTPDSQSLPVVCCVAELPPEFPRGDVIRESVRMAGFFFKLWRYRSREGIGEAEGADSSKAYAPIVIGRAPIWQQAAADAGSPGGLWIGVSLLAALAAICGFLWQTARRDRTARQRMRG